MRWSVLAVMLCGCGVAELTSSGAESLGEARQKEEWSSNDSPFLFAAELETRLDALPASGEAAHVPWAGSYWPVSADTINYRWGSGESPAKKYERAFGGSGVEEAVSRVHGIESAVSQRACSRDAECSAAAAEVCAKRRGASSGRCIPTWWGICHAWAPAAILWPEPRRAVVRGGVTFEVQDLKALASLVHDRTKSRFASLRCDSAASTFAFDHYGRPTDGACRDTNAGTYHVLLANYLGRLRQSFVEDRTIDDEVWNQPLRSFRVLSRREVTAAVANGVVGATGTTWQFNPAARRLVHVVTEVRWVSESDASEGWVGARIDAYTRSDRYEYVLELDGAGKIVGGEWGLASRLSHPDFVWLPTGPAAASVAGGAIWYDVVKQLVMESASAATASGDVSESFSLARDGWRFLGPFSLGAGPVTVAMTGTGDADLFVRVGATASSALYDCRPWLSTSNESCTVRGPGPLFVAVHAATAASVTVRVRAAARFSVSGSAAAGEMKVYPVAVSAGRAVVVRSASSSDVDVYARLGAAPNVSVYDARAISPSGNEVLRVVPRASGTLYVGVRAYGAPAAFTLTAAEE